MKKRICDLVINADRITKEQIDDILKSKQNAIQHYAYILHDKDVYLTSKEAESVKKNKGEYKNPHWHILLRFNTPQEFKYIAKWFNTKENFVRKITARFTDALKYLNHSNAPEKYQYEDNEVISNFDYKKEIKNAVSKSNKKKRLDEITTKIINGEIKEYNMYNQITGIEYRDNKIAINNAFQYRALKMEGLNRQMKCIFITGESGTGKTTLAKKIANNNKYSTYISSGSNDILDNYKGQECIILDDLRSQGLQVSDLLKMLDNHTASTVKSRYRNKVLECKLMIITTVNEIKKFFNEIFIGKEGSDLERETVVQLQRRCEIHIELDKVNIYYSMWDTKKNKYDYNVRIEKNTMLDEFKKEPLSKEEKTQFIKNVVGM